MIVGWILVCQNGQGSVYRLLPFSFLYRVTMMGLMVPIGRHFYGSNGVIRLLVMVHSTVDGSFGAHHVIFFLLLL